ncbi:MAG: phosphoribosylformylglycinamidine synthase I [Candidatus Eisenbacteria bacterium]|uniref:Phosphoribosylformylglycinamidine synthase subunit PurQ n=1 Tax=Eiseniibacteriota bacterium TaxID=2212470 RepID=A0A7Y2H2B2_UNCEI|nr:phosphoribosylformylglycinamidine synthase I [Candidatus Eisenbacteria bacterium]
MSVHQDELRSRVAVLQIPGLNCERETKAALSSVGLEAEIFRWNRPASELATFDAYVLPGGFSYQDRVRAGVVAAKAAVIDVIAEQAGKGKPVLGICNGAQILVESGLVPGIHPGHVEMALAPNERPGYYCNWVYVKVHKDDRETAFTSRFEEGEIFPVPMAHGEGRFTVRDHEQFEAWAEAGQVPLRYVTAQGDPARGFPANPNGSLLNAAGMTNPAGNVLAFMPHPERGAWLRQVPDTIFGPWGVKRREASRQRKLMDGPGPGLKIFQSLADYLQWDAVHAGEAR